MRTTIPLLIVLLCTSAGIAQPDTLWTRVLGDTLWSIGMDVEITDNQDLIVTGNWECDELDDHFFDAQAEGDVFLMKLNQQGDVLWNRLFDDGFGQKGKSVAPSNDGGWVLVGTTFHDTSTADSNFMYAAKADADGNMIWQRAIGGNREERGRDVAPIPGGGYLFAGWSRTNTTGLDDMYLVRTDEDGNVDWEWRYGGTNNDEVWSITILPSGNYVFTGRTWSYGAGGRDAFLMEITPDGDIVWFNTYGGADTDHFYEMRPAPDGGFINVGKTESDDLGGGDLWVVKTNSVGEVEWENTWGDAAMQFGRSCTPTGDGGYAFTGMSFVPGDGNQQLLLKSDSEGNWEWHSLIGGGFMEDGWAVRQTANQRYFVAGHTRSYGDVPRAVYLALHEADYSLLDCQLIPGTDPLILMPNSSFDWIWTLTNQSQQSHTGMDMWHHVIYPNGNVTADVFIYEGDLNLDPGATIGGSETQQVGDWADGNYSLLLGVGDYPAIEAVDTLTFTVDSNGVVEDPNLLAETFHIEEIYPNPFNRTATIQVVLPSPANLRIGVYDVTGRQVANVVEEETDAGMKVFHLDADGFSSGVYFIRAEAGTIVDTRKITFMK